MSEAMTSTDHDEIRSWAKERGGVPATVKGTAKGKKAGQDDAGILRLDFKPRDAELEEISWDEFFEKFDKENLAFLHQDKTADGKVSRFHKFVNRGADEKAGNGKKSASGSKSAGETKSGGKAKSESRAKSESGAKSDAAANAGGEAKSGGSAKGGATAKSGGSKNARTKQAASSKG